MMFNQRPLPKGGHALPQLLTAVLATVGLAAAIEVPFTPFVQAVELAQLRTAFVAPPRLVDSVATRTNINERNATYYLTLDLPTTAGVGLQTVQIRLDEGRDPSFRFLLDETRAFEGTRGNRGAELPLASVSEDRDLKTITLQFDPAVAPGREVTLALRPLRNPRFEGVYLFGVTATPAGEQAEPYFSGYARLSFYETDNDPFF